MDDDAGAQPVQPAAARTGFWVALVLSGLSLAALPWGVLAILPALVLAVVAWGLHRGNAWAGYGGALFVAVRWVGELAALARVGSGSTPMAGIVVATVVVGLIAWLLFRAGRALAGNGRSGSSLGWITLCAATLLASQMVRAYAIPTGAMEDTILIGDQLLARIAVASTPARGDLVVFHYPLDIRQIFVKRCMGVPGDRVKLVDKQLYVNGTKLQEPYAVHKTEYTESYRDNFPSQPTVYLLPAGQDMLEHHLQNGEIVVPPDSFFVLGDNRDSSLDSRYWGFVPRANIIGEAWIIYWSNAVPYSALGSATPSASAMADRYRGFFGGTRWSRILMSPRGPEMK